MNRTRRPGTIVRSTVAAVAVLVTTVAGTVVGTPAFAAPSESTPAAGNRPKQTINWAPCESDATADCGTLAVPIDWARPNGPTVNLAVARRKATDPANRVGSLLVNPGGPGGSGVDFVIETAEYFSPGLRSRFDLVGFDPRGIARSNGITCSTELMLNAPATTLTSQADFDTAVAFNQQLAADCAKRTGPLFDHVDTLSVVHDLDALRAAVGDPKLSYYGISYGTLIGQQYAEVYGGRARALVLDSNMDHSLGTRGFLMTETETAQDSFNEFVAWCDRTAACPLRAKGARAVYTDLKARADRGELQVPIDEQGGTLTVTSYLLSSLMLSGAYGPDWAAMADILNRLDTGDWSDDQTAGRASAAGVLRALAAVDRRSRVHGYADEELPEALDNALPVFCQDWDLPIRNYREYQAYMTQLNAVAKDVGPSPMAVEIVVSCLGWPGKVNNPQHRLRVTEGPTLFMTNALHDPATGYAWATNAARQLGRHAVLMTYEGWGHGVYGRSECTTAPIDAYLTNLAVPARGSRCPGVEPSPEPPAETLMAGPEELARSGRVPVPGGIGW